MRTIAFSIAALGLMIMGSCGGGVTETGNPKMYVTTTNVGDLAVWEVTPNSFKVVWQVKAAGVGATLYTYNLAGTCSVGTNFGFRDCRLATSTCAAGTSSCPANRPANDDLFNILEMPGVAILVYTPAQNQLHSGVLAGDCASNVAGDYTLVRTGIGTVDLFGLYRSDSSFSSIVRAGFAVTNPGAATLAYLTTDGGGTGATTLTSLACSNGVRTILDSGITYHSNQTAGGLFVYDFPSTLGGALAFRTNLAATATDLAGKSFYGFVFPDNASPTLAEFSTGALNGSQIPYTSLTYNTGTAPNISGQYLISAKAVGSTLGFNGNPPGPAATSYQTNTLSSTYATPGDFPGLFVNPTVVALDAGSIVTAMKVSGKVIFFGTNFGNRSGTIKNIGSFIFFEK